MQEKSAKFYLHCFGESGNSYKAALPMELSHVDWEPIFVDFFHGETRSETFLKLNPMGEAPVLVSRNLTLTQSGLIQRYISEVTGQFGGNSQSEKNEILRWLLWDNHKMSSLCGTARFLNNFIPQEKRPQEVILWHMDRLRNSFKVLDRYLKNRDWLVGDSPTIADFSCCGYLFYPEPFGFERSDWHNVSRWLEAISSLKGWKHPYDLMPRKKQT